MHTSNVLLILSTSELSQYFQENIQIAVPCTNTRNECGAVVGHSGNSTLVHMSSRWVCLSVSFVRWFDDNATTCLPMAFMLFYVVLYYFVQFYTMVHIKTCTQDSHTYTFNRKRKENKDHCERVVGWKIMCIDAVCTSRKSILIEFQHGAQSVSLNSTNYRERASKKGKAEVVWSPFRVRNHLKLHFTKSITCFPSCTHWCVNVDKSIRHQSDFTSKCFMGMRIWIPMTNGTFVNIQIGRIHPWVKIIPHKRERQRENERKPFIGFIECVLCQKSAAATFASFCGLTAIVFYF